MAAVFVEVVKGRTSHEFELVADATAYNASICRSVPSCARKRVSGDGPLDRATNDTRPLLALSNLLPALPLNQVLQPGRDSPMPGIPVQCVLLDLSFFNVLCMSSVCLNLYPQNPDQVLITIW
jgi:hypothetical protein